MTPFHVGMKVVCVDDKWHGGGWQEAVGIPCPLKNGEIYTVESIVDAAGWYKGGFIQALGLILHGVHKQSISGNRDFCAARFRPAHENRMEELRSLLVTPPSKAKTKKRVSA